MHNAENEQDKDANTHYIGIVLERLVEHESTV